jgi:hypothetical protein
VVRTKSRLTGAVTAVYPPTTADPLGSTGETVITTVTPNGWESFEANDICASCTFDGSSQAKPMTGPVMVSSDVSCGVVTSEGMAKAVSLV